MRLGIIDCGTNTFHLLIVEMKVVGTFEVVFKERQYVRLGQEGLHRIGEGPFRRGVECIGVFKNKMQEYGVEKHSVFGTEALRRASNATDFIRAVEEATGIQIHLISGDEEARLIHLGVMQAVPRFKGKALIMDIGGGSVEFIIASEREVFWAQSFPIGVQVLFSRFQKNDPISAEELAMIEIFLEATLRPLDEVLRLHQAPLLLGASGSFEVVEDMLFRQKEHPLYSVVSLYDYYSIHQKIIHASIEERRQMPGLPPERVELIVVAFALIDFVMRKAGIRQLITSAYALKEGILSEMLNVPAPGTT
ncbi:MAG: phosphatase [Bacteroidetes bacterium]|nr:phosphatase [Bacteroidota bacterium]